MAWHPPIFLASNSFSPESLASTWLTPPPIFPNSPDQFPATFGAAQCSAKRSRERHARRHRENAGCERRCVAIVPRRDRATSICGTGVNRQFQRPIFP
jgi:hypothetical protein